MEYKVGDVIRVEGCSSTWDGEYTITDVSERRYTINPPVGKWFDGISMGSRVDDHSKLISRLGCSYKVRNVIRISDMDIVRDGEYWDGKWDGVHTIEELLQPHLEEHHDNRIFYCSSTFPKNSKGFSEDSLICKHSKLYTPLSEKKLKMDDLLSLARQLHNLESDVWEIIGDQSWDF